MPAPDEEIAQAARAASLFFLECRKAGVPEPVALQLTSSYIFSRRIPSDGPSDNDEPWRK